MLFVDQLNQFRDLSTQDIGCPSGEVNLFFGIQISGPFWGFMSALFFAVCKVDANSKRNVPSGTSVLVLKHDNDGFRSNRSSPVYRRECVNVILFYLKMHFVIRLCYKCPFASYRSGS
jgi:hypothetical protein